MHLSTNSFQTKRALNLNWIPLDSLFNADSYGIHMLYILRLKIRLLKAPEKNVRISYVFAGGNAKV